MDEAIWDGYYDDDEMTEEDWDRYSADFERRYNEHARSVKSSGSRRVGRSTASRYYDEEDGLDNLLPSTEYLQRLARESGIDRDYNVHMAFRHAVEKMIRDDDTMASFFAYSQM
jgi:hypothetical protein